MSLTLQQRRKIVAFNVSHNGLYDGTGYPGHSPNIACEHFHIGTTYSCAIGNSFAFDEEGPRLVSMQPGWPSGYAYCPDGLNAARARHAIVGSWQTQPADLLFINTGSGAQPGHTEMVIFRNSGPKLQRQLEAILGVKLEANDEVMYSFGWDSGPSNVDRFTGQGGCHVHRWSCPKGVGNPAIIAAADASKLVSGATVPTVGTVPAPRRTKAAPLSKDTANKVLTVRSRLLHRERPVSRRGAKKLRALRAAINKALRRK